MIANENTTLLLYIELVLRNKNSKLYDLDPKSRDILPFFVAYDFVKRKVLNLMAMDEFRFPG